MATKKFSRQIYKQIVQPSTSPDEGFSELYFDSNNGGKPTVVFPDGSKQVLGGGGGLPQTTVGGEKNPIYLDNGELKASSTTVGASNKPVYSNKGVLTQCGSTLNVSVSGSAADISQADKLTIGKLNCSTFKTSQYNEAFGIDPKILDDILKDYVSNATIEQGTEPVVFGLDKEAGRYVTFPNRKSLCKIPYVEGSSPFQEMLSSETGYRIHFCACRPFDGLNHDFTTWRGLTLFSDCRATSGGGVHSGNSRTQTNILALESTGGGTAQESSTVRLEFHLTDPDGTQHSVSMADALPVTENILEWHVFDIVYDKVNDVARIFKDGVKKDETTSHPWGTNAEWNNDLYFGGCVYLPDGAYDSYKWGQNLNGVYLANFKVYPCPTDFNVIRADALFELKTLQGQDIIKLRELEKDLRTGSPVGSQIQPIYWNNGKPGLCNFKVQVVSELPQEPDPTTLYIVIDN